MDRELAINALLMAPWRRQPKETVMMHFDQGSQFSSYDWQNCAQSPVLDYIEMLYNPKRHHGSSGQLSPEDYKKQYIKRQASV